jgi:hypothetical protein
MIGSLHWIVTIGNFDIHTAVMTMSGFHIAPSIGHLERLRHILLPIYDEIHVNTCQNQRTRLL